MSSPTRTVEISVEEHRALRTAVTMFTSYELDWVEIQDALHEGINVIDDICDRWHDADIRALLGGADD